MLSCPHIIISEYNQTYHTSPSCYYILELLCVARLTRLLCILTSVWVMHISTAGQNVLLNAFWTKKLKKEKSKKCIVKFSKKNIFLVCTIKLANGYAFITSALNIH